MIGTKIEWATDTLQFWHGCSKVSEACRFCYAETMSRRFHRDHNGDAAYWGVSAPRLLRVQKAMDELSKIRRRAIHGSAVCQECGFTRINTSTNGRQHFCGKCSGAVKIIHERPRVFVNSMSDFFEDRRDLDEARLAALDAMRKAPEVDFLLLTKRPEKILELLARAGDTLGRKDSPLYPTRVMLGFWLQGRAPRNIWLGTTVENQEWAEKRIPEFLKVPAAVRFLSCEPLLGPVNLSEIELQAACYDCGTPITMNAFYATATCGCCCEGPESLATGHLDWIIVGGESGTHARPMHPDWARSLRDQCAGAGVAFHYKQHGEFAPGTTLDGNFVHPIQEGHFQPRAAGKDCHIWSDGYASVRVGKKTAGRLLDGVEHNGLPEVNP